MCTVDIQHFHGLSDSGRAGPKILAVKAGICKKCTHKLAIESSTRRWNCSTLSGPQPKARMVGQPVMVSVSDVSMGEREIISRRLTWRTVDCEEAFGVGWGQDETTSISGL